MAKNFNDLSVGVRVGILVALPALAALALFWSFVLPLSARRAALQAQVSSLHAENLKNQAFERQRQEYVGRIAELRLELDTVRAAVPDDESADSLIDVLNDTAVRTGINVRSLVTAPLVERDLYREVPFNLRLDGTYYDVVQFFDQLAHGRLLVNVSNLALGAPGRAGPGSYTVSPAETVGASCVVTTYANRPASAAPPQKAGH
ncbi:MAG TPA: type 4a pilus biogenesis protein PilO [Terriglobia bacterium]|nr:type 4a pilus biogenesis protein PilO [Terriglobia bacterium]